MREKIVVEDDIEVISREMPEDKDDFLPFENVEGINPMPSLEQDSIYM